MDEAAAAVGVTFSVLVRPPSGTTQCFEAHGAETVGAFKARIASQVAVPAVRQRLVFGGRTLDDARTFGEYNLCNESELMLVPGSSFSIFEESS